ncbi:DUF4145 domain-containing protein [Streptomyces olivaceus]|uniref:DUF4145 domain-containing protein n=1 Tax=Streptomyces TaxID=1883 RepID=UPI001FB5B802|nr:DUF4145 domain-containing protein [Streptomyces sp. CB09030]UOG81049.1 DUF4145 domain-containing protein [Streptomyces sp. CB09030]UOG81056.1 DUF4145 domain-containing protein [Streptomyces sp. CB09030]
MASSSFGRMPDPLQQRSFGRRRNVCPDPECAVGVAMSLRDRRQVYPIASSNLIVTTDGLVVYEELWSCDLCDRATVELVGVMDQRGTSQEEASVSWRRQVWPEPLPRNLSEDAPELVRSLFTDASKAENAGSYRLAGVGYRAAVEEICKDQGATKYKLDDKITELAERGLPQDVVDAMHAARVVGNDSIHQNLEYAAAEIADLANLIEEAALTLYVQPAERRRMAQARTARSEAARASK